MTESQQPQTTKSSRENMERSLWQQQVNAAMRLKFLQALTQTKFSLVDQDCPTKITKRTRIALQCECGHTAMRSVGQIVYDGVKACRKCGYSGMTAARMNCVTRKKKYATEDEKTIAEILIGARRRCAESLRPDFKNYGARGISFCFSSIPEGVAYVLAALGPRPKGYSLDRIDNNGDYAPGNLRWADARTQRLNQRPISKTGADFDRIARLQELRPDYSWESIRQCVKRGLTDEEIINRKKGKHYGTFTSQNLRHR